MLYDKARIFVQAGGGGDGAMSFRREAHVPRGGPDGGDGGRGGDGVLVCDDSLRDLQSFKRKAHYKARRGGHGEGALRHGADGGDLVVLLPPGTQGVDWEGTWYDLVAPGGGAGPGSALGPPVGGSCWPAAGRAVAATSASPPPRARRRASPSAGWKGR